MTEEEFIVEYRKLAHAVQTGVAYDQSVGGSQDGTPKHLRTGLSCVMADVGSLGRLLIMKGLITKEEYYEAILGGMQAEVAAYEARLANQMGPGGTKITLM